MFTPGVSRHEVNENAIGTTKARLTQRKTNHSHCHESPPRISMNIIEAPFVHNYNPEIEYWKLLPVGVNPCWRIVKSWWFGGLFHHQSIRLNPGLWCKRYWLHTFPWARLAKGIIAIIGKVAQSFSKLCCCFGLIYFFLGPKVTNIKQALWWLKCTTIPKQWQATSVFKLKLPIIASHPNTETSPPADKTKWNNLKWLALKRVS